MKTMRTLFQKEAWIKGMLGVAVFVLFFTCQVLIGEAAEGKVTAETAKIRAQASTDSEVVGSTVKGKTIDILGAVKDASGMVWYKVSVTNGGYGYIRSDLVQTSDTIEVTSSSSSSSSESSATSEKPAETVPTSIGETAAFTSQDSVRIRSGASTSHDAVTSLTKGTAITLIGEATDSAGNKWYQMTCNKNGKTVEGYVRADLITVGEAPSAETGTTEAGEGNGEESAATEGTEAENTEGADGENAAGTEDSQESEVNEPAEPEHNDYEVVYNDETYWLYDNTNGTMMSVTNLLDVVNQVNENNTSLQSQVKNEKIIIIILAVIIVILVIVMTVLIFKLKDAYYYEDYEDEEEEEEEEPEPVIPKKKKKNVKAEEFYEEPVPVKKKKVKESFPEGTDRSAEKTVKKKRPEAELQAAEEKKPVKKPAPRKTQNFLVDDDEFEFEFLNMDDKDL